MRRLTTVGVLVAIFWMTATGSAVNIVWDGGNGNWADGKWNGGQTAFDVFARDNGLVVGSGEIGTDAFISSGNLTYDPNTYGDFRFIEGAPGNGGTLTISGGASLSMDSNAGDVDGLWTQFNANTLNLNNGTLRRTFSGPTTEAGGVFGLGGIRGSNDMDIKVNLTHGGRIENSGPMTFGWYLSDYANRRVTMTINNGTLDLTGGDNHDYLDGAVGGAGNADLQFHLTWNETTNAPNNDHYAVNFTGPGSITVDHSGILVVVQTGSGIDFDFSTITTLRTYQDLWNLGILQAKGRSGMNGATFSNYFTTMGTPGTDNYILTSRVVNGDFNADGSYGCTDINSLVVAIQGGTNPAAFDLTGDGLVNLNDRDAWLSEAGAANIGPGKSYLLGDANLSGAVDGSDFGIWNSHKFTSVSEWCSGDFNADGAVDGSDFGLWNTNKFTSSDSAVVPEPATLCALGLLGVVAVPCLRIRRRNG